MAITAKLYNKFLWQACKDSAPDVYNNTLKCALLTSTYTPNQIAHILWSSCSPYEVSGTGYVAGGATLANKAWGFTGQVLWLYANDVQWTLSSITARYAVIYDYTSADKFLVCYIDFGEDRSSVGGTFKIGWNAEGIFKITIA